MNVVAIIAARMGSQRLPKKTLLPILGIPMLKHMVDRLNRCKHINQIVVGTSTAAQDDEIVDFGKKYKISVKRGSEEDVLGRYYDIAKVSAAEVVVRVTGDCPLIDPEVTDLIVHTHLKSKNNDLTSNVIDRTYPRGLDTEVLSYECLERVHKMTLGDSLYREHVTNYIYDHPDKFTTENVAEAKNHSDLRWCVDTADDFKLVTEIYTHLYPKNSNFGLADILNFVHKNPHLKTLNSSIQQKKIFRNRIKP